MIHFDIANLELELKELESKTNSPDFWQTPEKNTPILTKIKGIQNKLEKYNKIQSELSNIENLNDLLIIEYDKELSEELILSTNSLEEEINKLEIQTLLAGKYDRNNAILTLHPGAGGTESQDWAEMLYRMYSRWANKNGYGVKELEYLEGDEAGIKSVTFLISGTISFRTSFSAAA